MSKNLGKKGYEKGFEYEKNYDGCAHCVIAVLFYGQELNHITDPEIKRFVDDKLSKKLNQKFLDVYGTATCAEIQTKMMGRSFDLYTEWSCQWSIKSLHSCCRQCRQMGFRIDCRGQKKGISEILKNEQ